MGRGGEAKPLMSTENSNEASSHADYGGTRQDNPLSKMPAERQSDNHETALLRLPPPSSRTADLPRKVWLLLIVSVGVGLVGGSMYGFGRYAKDLREALHISQTTVQGFGILIDTGNYIGHPLTGLFYDRFGPKVSCWAASLIVFSSYLCIHCGLHYTASSAPIWIMNLGFLGVGFGSGLGYIAGLGSTTNAFAGTPHLGRAVGFVAAGCGFSSTLVGISYHHTGLKSFFLLWAILGMVMNVIGAFVFSSDNNASEEQEAVGTGEEGHDDLEQNLLSLDELSSTTLSIASDEDGENGGEWTSWKRLDFWLLFGSFACITGCGLMIINNISTAVQSIGGADALAGYLVVCLSICNVIGRIFMGSLADHPKLHKLDLYRYASLLMALAVLVSALGGRSTACLAFTVACAAISYGGSWVLIIGILTDFYGKQHFGKDYGLIAMGPALSGMVFNAMSAKMYEDHADNDTGVCMGAICYRDSFLMTAASATVGYLMLLLFLPGRPR